MTTEPGSGMPSSSPPPEPAPPAAAPGSESTADMLRSMLSKAVEDQLLEQAEIAGAMTDMRSMLMRLGQELAEMRVAPPPSDASDAQLNNVTVEMREAVRFLSERLDGVSRMVAQRGEDLADIRSGLTTIDAHLRSQAETIGVLSAGLQSLPSYGERVSVLQDNLQVVHRQLLGIEAGLAAAGEGQAEERLAAIETAIAPIAGRLEAVAETSLAQSASMAELPRSLAAVQSALAAMHERIEPLATDVTTIGGHVAGLVEGTADGAALDSRVRESVSHAMRDTEQRLIEHINEAVLALAQTLLKRRPTAVATPSVEATEPIAEPVAEPLAEPEPEPAAVESDVEVVAEFAPAGESDAEPAPSDAGPDDDAAASDAVPGGEWAIDGVLIGEPTDGDGEPAPGDGESVAPGVPAYIEPTPAWPPQTPPERDPDEPAAETADQPDDTGARRKRRWFGS